MAGVFAILLLACVLFAGCGGFVISSDGCLVAAVRIEPDSAVADHRAPPPANVVLFTAFQTTTPNACFDRFNVVFITSDPLIASVSNAHDRSFGMATCLRPSANPVTITAMSTSSNGKQVRSTATLICR